MKLKNNNNNNNKKFHQFNICRLFQYPSEFYMYAFTSPVQIHLNSECFFIIMMSTFRYQVIVWFVLMLLRILDGISWYLCFMYNVQWWKISRSQWTSNQQNDKAPGLSTKKTFQNYFTEQFIEFFSLLTLLNHRVALEIGMFQRLFLLQSWIFPLWSHNESNKRRQ